MKRKITILTIAFLSSVLMCANVFAAASGRCGDSITWTLDDSGNLTLSGSGEMWNYGYDTSPFKEYEIRKAAIEDGITSIGKYAFYGCSGLTELILPNSVTSIGNAAFVDCSGLAKITSLAEIPPVCSSNVFDGVNKINCELIVPIVSVVAYKQARGWNEFSNITAAPVRCGDSITWTLDDLGNLTLSGSGEMWDYVYNDSPFKDSGIKTVTIEDGITSIGDCAFYGCSGLTELTLPNSVTSIGDRAFAYCSGLTELTLPNSVTSIGDRAFAYCSGLTELTLPNGVRSIGDYAFSGCSGLTELILPSSVTSIGDYAFYGCSGLTELTLPNSVTSIGDGAFLGCSGLTELTLPNSLTEIGKYAFRGCSGLTELILPNSVTSIGESAFSGCSGLEKIAVESGNSCYDSRDNCNSIIDTETNTLIVGCKNSVIPNSVTSIGDSAFSGCSGMTELILPNSVTSIGDFAFLGCRGLTELTLPNSVTSIGNYAFSDCSGLEKITVESGNSRYDSRDNCNSIIETKTNTLIAGCKNSIIPNSVTSIGNGAFFACTGLTELTLPNGITRIEESAFRGCRGLTELTLPSSVTSIGNSAFCDCSGLTELTLPNSITSIGQSAFYGCSGLTELTLPNSVTSIGDGAFGDCSGLSKITSLAEIPPVCGSGVFDRVNKTNCKLIVPIVSVIAYKQAEVWNEFSNIRGFSGVEVTMADRNTIRVIGNQIEISGYFTSVEVYGVNGTLIYKGKDNVVTVPSAGIYLVHVAGKTRKIVVE